MLRVTIYDKNETRKAIYERVFRVETFKNHIVELVISGDAGERIAIKVKGFYIMVEQSWR